MEQSKMKVKKHSNKYSIIIMFLLTLLIICACFSVYFITVDKNPSSSPELLNESTENITTSPDSTSSGKLMLSKNIVEEHLSKNTSQQNLSNTPAVIPDKDESVNTTITPEVFAEVETKEIMDFVDQFAIGINRLSLEEENLESNTILLYIAQQYFNSKSNKTSSLAVDTTYTSSLENFHKFLSEFTVNDYSNVQKIDAFGNYIGYTSRTKSYVYGKDYLELSKEKYTCTNVTITDKNDNLYSAKADVTRTSELGTSTYEITFSFKVNKNYKYQKFKLLSLSARNTSDIVDNTIHFVSAQ